MQRFLIFSLAMLFAVLVSSQPAAAASWLVFADSGYLEVPADRSPSPTSEMTVEAWIYLISDTSYAGELCLSILGRGFLDSYWFGLCDRRLRLYTHGVTSEVTGDAQVPLNTWTHVAATYDGAAVRFYIDGVLDATLPAPPPPMPASTQPLRIGSDVNWPHTPMGMIRQVRVWTRALVQDELQLDRHYRLRMGRDGLAIAFNFDTDVVKSWEFPAYEVSLQGGARLGDGIPPCIVERWIPGSGHASGFGGSQWRTDLDLMNPGSDPVEVRLSFAQKGVNGTVSGPALLLDPGETTRLEDVVLDGFGMDSATGAILICATGPVQASSRTFNLADGGSTFGQGIPAVSLQEAVTSAQLLGLSEDGTFRTNLGLLNPGRGPVTVHLTLRDASGTVLGVYDQSLDRLAFTQLDRVFGLVTQDPVTGGRIEISVDGGSVVAYASVVDEVTGDGTFLLAGAP